MQNVNSPPLVGICLGIKGFKRAAAYSRLGRRWCAEVLPPIADGETVWAWREGQFDRAKILAHQTVARSGVEKLSVYRVGFESPPAEEADLPSGLIRMGDTRPEATTCHEWHRQRRQKLLRQHPEILEIKALPGVVYIVMMAIFLALQLTVGAWIGLFAGPAYLGLWTLVLAATVGAFCAYALQQLTHEACHTKPNRLAHFLAFSADIMLGTTGPCFYSYYFQHHIPHHANTGDASDPDILLHGHWAVLPKWASRTRLGRFLWISLMGLFTFEVMIIEHLVGRIPQPRLSFRNRRLVAVLMAKYAFMGLVFWLGGLWCLVYFRLAAAFSLGAFGHPYAGFWLMQHASVAGTAYQPTLSYGGSWLWHWLALGELYHVEHHDFPWVPFNRIATIRQIAPEYYRDLCVVPSVWGLTWQWLSHTDGSPWMDVAGALDCINPPKTRSDIHRPSPDVVPV